MSQSGFATRCRYRWRDARHRWRDVRHRRRGRRPPRRGGRGARRADRSPRREARLPRCACQTPTDSGRVSRRSAHDVVRPNPGSSGRHRRPRGRPRCRSLSARSGRAPHGGRPSAGDIRAARVGVIRRTDTSVRERAGSRREVALPQAPPGSGHAGQTATTRAPVAAALREMTIAGRRMT